MLLRKNKMTKVCSVVKFVNEHSSRFCQINHDSVVDCTWQSTEVSQHLSIPLVLLFLMLDCSTGLGYHQCLGIAKSLCQVGTIHLIPIQPPMKMHSTHFPHLESTDLL